MITQTLSHRNIVTPHKATIPRSSRFRVSRAKQRAWQVASRGGAHALQAPPLALHRRLPLYAATFNTKIEGAPTQ